MVYMGWCGLYSTIDVYVEHKSVHRNFIISATQYLRYHRGEQDISSSGDRSGHSQSSTSPVLKVLLRIARMSLFCRFKVLMVF